MSSPPSSEHGDSCTLWCGASSGAGRTTPQTLQLQATMDEWKVSEARNETPGASMGASIKLVPKRVEVPGEELGGLPQPSPDEKPEPALELACSAHCVMDHPNEDGSETKDEQGQDRERCMDWRLLALVALTFAGLSAAAGIGSMSSTTGRLTLPALLAAQSVMTIGGTVLTLHAPRPVPVPWLDVGGNLVLLSFVVLLLQLVVRLFSVSTFGGDPVELDFGLKCKEGVCVRNLAFEFEFNTVGHCIQGCCALLLFPVADMVIVRMCMGREKMATFLISTRELCIFIVAFYPVYNVVKRSMKSTENFAVSSFSNNATEWAGGFALGLCAVPACAALCAHGDAHAVINFRSHIPTTFQVAMSKVRVAIGLLLVASSLASGLLFILSWDADPGD